MGLKITINWLINLFCHNKLTLLGRTICAEPYRFFFPAGILIGIIGVGHWLAFALGWLPGYSGFLHSALQIQAYMICFVLGFLLTFLPRFTQAPTASGKEMIVFILLIAMETFFLLAGRWIVAEFCFVGLLVTLVLFAKRRFTPGRMNGAPPEFIWMPIALLHGILGSLLLALGQMKLISPWFLSVGKGMVQQGFLLSIVLGIGGFLAPRLMGLPQQGAASRRQRVWVNLTAGVILFSSFWMEGLGWVSAAYGLRAAVAAFAFLRSGLLQNRPKAPDFFLKLLRFSIWMVVLGYWMGAFLPRHKTMMLHFVFIGGYSLMTFAVATMVVLSHGGEGARLQKPLWILNWIAVTLPAALAFRLAAQFFPAFYFQLLGISGAIWLTAAVGWFFFILPRVLRLPKAGEFEQLHAQMKERIANLQGPHVC